MGKKVGNPNIAEIGKNTQFKKGVATNPDGPPKKVTDADLLQFDIESLIGRAMPKAQAKRMIEAIDLMLLDDLIDLYHSKRATATALLKMSILISALDKKTSLRDRVIASEYIDKSAPKEKEAVEVDAVEAVKNMMQQLKEQRQKEFE